MASQDEDQVEQEAPGDEAMSMPGICTRRIKNRQLLGRLDADQEVGWLALSQLKTNKDVDSTSRVLHVDRTIEGYELRERCDQPSQAQRR